MQKRCLTCNALIDVNAKFCQKCGSNNFSQPIQQPIQQPNTIGYEGGQAFNNVPPVQPPMNFAPTEPPKKKGMAPWQIILIVLVSVAVAILVYFLVTDLADKNSDSSDEKEKTKVTEITQQSVEPDTNNNNNNPDNPPLTFDVPYTKGEVVGNNYVNEWANISVSTSKWPEADKSYYSNFESATTECGYVHVDTATGTVAGIMFEDISSIGKNVTISEYIEASKRGITLLNGNAFEIDSNHPTVTIAGETYHIIDLKHTTSGMYMRYFVRIKDNRGIMFFATGFDKSSLNSFVNSITQCNSL